MENTRYSFISSTMENGRITCGIEDMELRLQQNEDAYHHIKTNIVVPQNVNIHIEFDILWESGTLEGYPCFTDVVNGLRVSPYKPTVVSNGEHKLCSRGVEVKNHEDFRKFLVRGVATHVSYDGLTNNPCGRFLSERVDVIMSHAWVNANTEDVATVTLYNIKFTASPDKQNVSTVIPDYEEHLDLVRQIDEVTSNLIYAINAERVANAQTVKSLYNVYDDMNLDNDTYANAITRQLLDEEINSQAICDKEYEDIKLLSTLKTLILRHILGEAVVNNNNSSRTNNVRVAMLITRCVGTLTKEQINIINEFDLSNN